MPQQTTQSQINILSTILKEVRALRKEVSFLIPEESVEDYKHPARIGYPKNIQKTRNNLQGKLARPPSAHKKTKGSC